MEMVLRMTQALDTLARLSQAAKSAAPPPPAPIPFSTRVAVGNQIGTANFFENVEVKRIINLPLVLPMEANELEEFNRTHVMANQFDAGWRLFPAQANSILAYTLNNGLFCSISVGWGKTLVGLACMNAAYAKGIQRGMLIVPPNVLNQLITTDIAFARSKVGINYPIHIIGGRTAGQRKAIANSGRRGLYITTYSLLSAKDAHQILMDIKPEIIILDEAHNVSKRTAARTKRLFGSDGYITHHQPEIVAMSGTITKKSVKDFYHLIKSCLKKNCPMPMADRMAEEWAQLLDASASGPDYMPPSSGTGPLLPLIAWARKWFPDDPQKPPRFTDDVFGFRRAFHERLNTVPGVVTSGSNDIGVSLQMVNQPVADYEKCDGWLELKRLMGQIDNLMLTPNGDQIEHAIHCYKWKIELTAGFYNELTWPTVPVYAARKSIPEAKAAGVLEHALVHHKAGQVYAHDLRDWLKDKSKPGLDTPFLVGGDMIRHEAKNVGHSLYRVWKEMRDLDFEGRPERDSRAVRVCPYKVNAAIQWIFAHVNAKGGEAHGGAILWVNHIELGIWLTEILKLSGVEAIHCPAGARANDEICAIGDPNRGGKGDKIVVASYHAHGQGKNLQSFQHQYFVEFPREADKGEQTLGRTHRNGQEADELVVFTNRTLEFDHVVFAATLNDALYAHQTSGNRQKLIYASYDPLPKIYPPSVLAQLGLDAIALTEEQRRQLVERFGGYNAGG